MKKLLLSAIFLLGAGMAQAQLNLDYNDFTYVKRVMWQMRLLKSTREPLSRLVTAEHLFRL